MNNEDEKLLEEPLEEPLEETLDFTHPDYTFIPKEVHDWRAQGPYLICKSCEITHAVYIGMEKMLVGLDSEGKPLFENREDRKEMS